MNEFGANTDKPPAPPADPPFDSLAHPLVGTALGPYLLQEVLGHGAAGVVFRAQVVGTEPIVAVKLLHPHLAPTPEAWQRFATETETLRSLSNANIVRCLQVGPPDGPLYYATDYVGKRTLARRLKRGPLSLEGAAMLVWHLANAVKDCHRVGITHRALQPGKVLLTSDDKPKLADFGLARLLGRDTLADGGPVAYLAPEQAARQRDIDFEKVDIYALGAILYECLTGRAPFRAATRAELLQKIRSQLPVPPSEYDERIPLELEAIALKCLAKKPRQRYASADVLAADLTQWLLTKKSTATPPPWLQLYRKTKRLLVPLGFVVGAVLLSAGLYVTDPARAAERLHRQLERGETVTRLTADAPTVPYHIRYGSGATVTTNADGSLTVHSPDGVTVLELFPKVPLDSFSVRCQVRHRDGAAAGCVGLYVGGRRDGEALTFTGLTYNDVSWEVDAAPAMWPVPSKRLHFGLGSLGQPGADQFPPPWPEPLAEYQALGPAGATVRELGFDLRPTGIDARWNGEVVGHLRAMAFDERGRRATRGSIGLLIHRGTAVFSKLELLPNPPPANQN